jgi:hypothetical protein
VPGRPRSGDRLAHGTRVITSQPLTLGIPDNGTFVLGEVVEVGGGYVWEQESGPRPDPLIVGGVEVSASCAESTIFLAKLVPPARRSSDRNRQLLRAI